MQALLLSGINDALRGLTTLERIAGPQDTLYWVPAKDGTQQGGRVVPCPRSINLYDLGYQSNWADLMARPLIGPFNSKR